MCDTPSPDHSPPRQDSRGQTKLTEYFSSSNSAHASKRSRTACQVIANSSPAKRCRNHDEEVANNQNKSDINLKGSLSSQDSRGQIEITEYFSSSNNAHASKRSQTPCQVIVNSSPAKHHKSDDEEIANNQNRSDINLKDSEAKEGDNVSLSLSTGTVTDKLSAVHVDKLSLAGTPEDVFATSDASPRKEKMSSSIANLSDVQKVGKYTLRSIRKFLDEDTTPTEDNQRLMKKRKRLESSDVSAPEDDNDDAEVSLLTHTTNSMNLEFYRNKIRSVPDGDFIETILTKWKTDFKKLEQHHGYIQWLFPLKEIGMNNLAQVLQDDEAMAIKEDAVLKERVLRAYKMMLGFYGLVLLDEKTGAVGPSYLFQKQMENLNSSFHNNLRITRILKALGEFGFEHLKQPLVLFLIKQAFLKNTLVNCRRSCVNYWIPTLKIKEEQENLEKMVKDLEKRELRRTPRFYF